MLQPAGGFSLNCIISQSFILRLAQHSAARSDRVSTFGTANKLCDQCRKQHLCGTTAAKAAIREAEAAGGQVAAFFCESELSCAGSVMLPEGFLADVYREMQQHGAVCIADEVQCGFGRLGDTFWGYQAHVRIPSSF